jgi:Tfp pilus assembly protein FimT
LGQRGHSLFELLAVFSVAAILAAIAVPGAASTSRALGGQLAAERLALLLRTAQACAQEQRKSVQVTVAADGHYQVQSAAGTQAGELGAPVSSNYPAGTLAFDVAGRPCLPGGSVPRAGTFTCGASTARVVVQLSGYVRRR